MKSKFGKLLVSLVFIWFIAISAYGIKLFIDLQVPEEDETAIQQLESSLLKFQKDKGQFPAIPDDSKVDVDLETDTSLMKWLATEKNQKVEALRDSQNNLFRIRLDSDGDGKVYSPIDNEPITKTVVIWSAGKDGKFASWRDNGRSW